MTNMASPPSTKLVSLNDLTVVAGNEELLQANGLDSLDALFVPEPGEALDKPGLESWRERFRLTLEGVGAGRTAYLKRFRDPPPAARREVRRAANGARSVAGLEWSWMHRLAADGIPCVRPIAWGEQLEGSRERRSAVISAAVPGRSLERWTGEWSSVDRPRIRSLLPVAASLVASLHRHGYVHRDLYLSHVFYEPTASLDESLCLIDLQRVKRPVWFTERWLVKDLAALNYSTPASLVSRTDRLRWLKLYLGGKTIDARAKRLAWRVVGKTLQIARHDRRRLARVAKRGGAGR